MPLARRAHAALPLLPLALLLALLAADPACCPEAGQQEDPLAPGLHAAGGVREALDEGPFLPLSARGDRLVDAVGRQAILRGLQHHALQDVDYQGREVLAEDYQVIAGLGFTTLRMAISWSRIEPRRGEYDDRYLDELRAAMDLAAAAGLTVILEWHQDFWARCSQAKGSQFSVNANGAPDWTCPPTYQPSTFGYLDLFDRFWDNADGLFDSFVAAWSHVVGRLGSHPALLGLDLFNEPQGTAGSPQLERDHVYPAYRVLVPALRAQGASALLFVEPPGLRNEIPGIYTEPLTDLGANVVYAPHLYSSWITLFLFHQPVAAEVKQRDFSLAALQAAALGLPLWDGEWGVNLLLPSALADLELHVGLEDHYRIGSSYWAWNQAIPGQGDDSISGGHSLLDEQRRLRQDVADRLSRPYPIQTPGTIERLAYDFGSRVLEVELLVDSTQVPLVLYAPRRHLGRAICLSVEGSAASGFGFADRADRERVLVRFAASGRHLVRLAPCRPSV